MDLSIIIVNYNVRQFLESALNSITKALSGIEGEIIVVDNASDDDSAGMVRRSFPKVIVIENTENLGFARANNIALKRARGRFLLLINPDTVVQEDTINTMLRFFENHPDAGLAGCKILNPDGSFQLPCRRSFPTPWVAFTKVFGLSRVFPKSRLFGRYNLTFLSPDETYAVDAVSGSFMMIRRDVYERIGDLDEMFFMYAEDLDWCYRVNRAGFKVYYVHSTSIIHYKGESARRSSVNERRMFYKTMQQFVTKHYRHSAAMRLFLSIGIAVRETVAWLNRFMPPVLLAAIDFALVDVALFLSAWAYFGDPSIFPRGASLVVWVAPSLLVLFTLAGTGSYSTHRSSIIRAFTGTVLGYMLISAAVFFEKQFGYSRAVVILSGVLSFVLLPGWRFALRRDGQRGLLGNRTLVVGTGPSAREILRKLRARIDGVYDVVGFIDTTNQRIGESVDGVAIVGSLENVGKVVNEQRVSDVVFSTDGLSYGEILSIIARSGNRAVNFLLVPNSMESIIGKTRIDQLDTLPLVEIEYSIRRAGNRAAKRIFDLLVGSLLMIVAYLPCYAFARRRSGSFARLVLAMPKVLSGQLSLVGLPYEDGGVLARSISQRFKGADLGPLGVTGLIQINQQVGLGQDEIDRYALYYAKNQSVGLDAEILLKAVFLRK